MELFPPKPHPFFFFFFFFLFFALSKNRNENQPKQVLLKPVASDARGYICKICDFGLARVLTSSSAAAAGGGGGGSKASSSRSGSLPASLSVASAVASAAAAHPAFTHVSTHTHGTLAYQAPEVISQGRVGRPADVFSLAVLAAELLGGWKPFRALPLGAVVHAIVYSHER